jgi:hypothetical protein
MKFLTEIDNKLANYGAIMWHEAIESQGSNNYFLGYTEGNDFFEVVVYDDDTYEIRLFAGDGWVTMVDLSTSN